MAARKDSTFCAFIAGIFLSDSTTVQLGPSHKLNFLSFTQIKASAVISGKIA